MPTGRAGVDRLLHAVVDALGFAKDLHGYCIPVAMLRDVLIHFFKVDARLPNQTCKALNHDEAMQTRRAKRIVLEEDVQGFREWVMIDGNVARPVETLGPRECIERSWGSLEANSAADKVEKWMPRNFPQAPTLEDVLPKSLRQVVESLNKALQYGSNTRAGRPRTSRALSTRSPSDDAVEGDTAEVPNASEANAAQSGPPCKGFEVLKRHVLTSQVQVQKELTSSNREKVWVRSRACMSLGEAGRSMCENCRKTKGTCAKYIRNAARVAVDTMGFESLKQAINSTAVEVLHRSATAIQRMENELKRTKQRMEELRKERELKPLSKLVHKLEHAAIFTQKSFLYRFTSCMLSAYEYIIRAGTNGLRWETLPFGREMTVFFMIIRNFSGGRTILRFLRGPMGAASTNKRRRKSPLAGHVGSSSAQMGGADEGAEMRNKSGRGTKITEADMRIPMMSMETLERKLREKTRSVEQEIPDLTISTLDNTLNRFSTENEKVTAAVHSALIKEWDQTVREALQEAVDGEQPGDGAGLRVEPSPRSRGELPPAVPQQGDDGDEHLHHGAPVMSHQQHHHQHQHQPQQLQHGLGMHDPDVNGSQQRLTRMQHLRQPQMNLQQHQPHADLMLERGHQNMHVQHHDQQHGLQQHQDDQLQGRREAEQYHHQHHPDLMEHDGVDGQFATIPPPPPPNMSMSSSSSSLGQHASHQLGHEGNHYMQPPQHMHDQEMQGDGQGGGPAALLGLAHSSQGQPPPLDSAKGAKRGRSA